MKVAKDAFYSERTNMVRNQLIPNQIYDSRILDAMESVPRHIFVEEKWRPVAYVDENIPACVGRKLLSPLLLAKMLSCCNLKDNATVLDVGFGSGYSIALLAKIVKSVTAIESNEHMLFLAADNVSSLGISNYICMHGDLSEGPMDGNNFDAIIVNGILSVSPDGKPDKLISQLKKAGVLVVIEKVANVSVLVKYSHTQGSVIRKELQIVDAPYIA